MKNVFLFLMIGLACTISMTSCTEDDKEPGNVPLTGIIVEPDFVEVDVRNGAVSENVKVYPVPANATDVDFKWETQDPNMATVETDELGVGKITVLKNGSTVVTVRSGQVTKEIQVDGYISIIELEGIRWSVIVDDEPVTDSPLSLPVGKTVKLIAIPYPVNANTEDSNTVTLGWESSNEDVATIDQDGSITVAGAGTATITVSCAEYEDISVEIVIEGYLR
jgi:uncharacterized protein YjdB